VRRLFYPRTMGLDCRHLVVMNLASGSSVLAMRGQIVGGVWSGHNPILLNPRRYGAFPRQLVEPVPHWSTPSSMAIILHQWGMALGEIGKEIRTVIRFISRMKPQHESFNPFTWISFGRAWKPQKSLHHKYP